MAFAFPCPACGTTNALHGARCRFGDRDPAAVEKAYVDILSVLSTEPHTKAALRSASHGTWDALHEAAFESLVDRFRVRKVDDEAYEVLTPAERRDAIVPTEEPMRTVYEQGSVPGCHDNAAVAMVAWCESMGMDWERTREYVAAWLRESGAWDRGGFEQPTPEAVVDDKRHVHDRGYGYYQKAQAAKAVIEARNTG